MTDNLGKVILEKRKEKKLTQEDLAQDLYVTRQSVSNWERNITIPDPSMLEKLSSIFGENLTQLFEQEKYTHETKELKHMASKQNTPYSVNKYDTAIGLFYSVALFIGLLVGVLYIMHQQLPFGSQWVLPAILSLLIFLILGLLMHAIITLARKD